MSGLDALEHRIRPGEGEPTGALVLFHGRGTDENDLFPLLDYLDPERRFTGLTPRGPLSLPPGGAHWYIVRDIGFPDRETFDGTFALASDWLDSLQEELGVPPERTVLGGFSQGAVMSYALSFSKERPKPAAVVAMSGFIPTVDGLELDFAGRNDIPVAVAHGVHDPIIGVEWGRDARERLEVAGAPLVYHEAPMAHGVDPRFLVALRPWLSDAVPVPG